jgi:peptide/nickel transport system substrate-binding protein
VASDDWYSSTAESKAFTDRAYRGMHESSSYWYVGWNLDKPQLADPRVRRALAHLFDFEEFRKTYYRGYAEQITGPFSPRSPAYDRDVKPYAYDPKAAAQLLTDAGWYDRDGDGIVDHDGKPLSIELALEAGNPVNQAFAAKLQEDLAHAGVQLRIAPMELKSLVAKRNTGDFDAIALGWAPPFESDPGQLWHSVPAGAPKSSNFVDFKDAETDALIEKGRAELDPSRRAEIWRAIHRRVYELQPYMFCFNVSRKYVMIRALRGFQSVAIDPYYVVRRWYYPAGTPGTRATAAIKQD